MSKIFVGSRAQNLNIGEDVAQITRVNLVVDSDHMYTAGSDTGRTMEVECPWGSQEMAESVLRRVGSVDYKPYSAEKAMIDPAFELGDAVTVGGVYSGLYGADKTYNGATLVNIEAPDLDEIDDEYPAQQTQQSSIKRQLAYTRSLITKTAEEIRLSVEGVDGRVSALSVTLEGVTITDASGRTFIKGSSIETGSVTADKLNITGAITFNDLASDVQNDINDAYALALSADASADSAVNTVSAWSYPGTTYIDGRKLMTGTVMATNLLGASVGLLAANQTVVGSMDIAYTSTGIGLGINTDYGGIQINASGGNVYLASGYGQSVTIGNGYISLGGGALLLPVASYGTSLPSTGTYGQVFFLLES